MKISDAKEAMGAAMGLRQALIRMRQVLGQQSSAIVCERHAEDLLNGEDAAAHLSPQELRALRRRVSDKAGLLKKIIAVLGDRTMHIGEIHQAVVALGTEDYPGLRQYVSNRINKHSAGKGDELFMKVKFGWYRLRKRSEHASEPKRLKKGELVRTIYDVMGTDSLDQHEISRRLITQGLLPSDRSEPARVIAVLINHSVRGTQCFAKDKKDHKKWVAVPGRQPSVDTPELVTLEAIRSTLRGAPLSISEIHERLVARKSMHDVKLSVGYVGNLLSRNSGNAGYRMFEQLSPRIFRVAKHMDILDQVMTVLGSRPLTPAQVTALIADTGYKVRAGLVYSVMQRKSGAGMPLIRVSRGLYSKNPEYRK